MTEPVLPPLTRRPVEPSADLSMVMEPPLSRSTVLFEFSVIAAPEVTAIAAAAGDADIVRRRAGRVGRLDRRGAGCSRSTISA